MTAWQAADKAYQQHATSCAQCRAAGTSQGSYPRCSTGQAHWDTYNAAGMPPHFTWLHSSPAEQTA